MKANLSPNLALKLSLNENYFTEELKYSFFIPPFFQPPLEAAKPQSDIPEQTYYHTLYNIYIIYIKYVVISQNNLLNMK